MVGYSIQGTFQVVIVAVEVRDDITSGSPETLVDGVRLAAIFLAYPVGQPALVFPNNFDTPICAAAVDDDVFQIRIILIENRVYRLLDEGSLVEGWRDNRNSWSRRVHYRGPDM